MILFRRVVCLAVSLWSVCALAATPEVAVEFEVGATAVVENTALVTGATATPADTKVVTVTVDAGKATITGTNVGTERIVFKKDEQEILIANVRVIPVDPIITLRRGGKAVELTDEIMVLSGDVFDLDVQGHNHDGSPRAVSFTVTPEQPSVVSFDAAKKQLTIKELANTDVINPPRTVVPVTVKVADATKTINFRILERPTKVDVALSSPIKEETSQTIPVTVTGSGGGVYHSTSSEFAQMYHYGCKTDPIGGSEKIVAVTAADAKTLAVGKFTGTGNPKFLVTCTASALERATSQPGKQEIAIFASGGKLRVTPASLSLFGGQQAPVVAEVLDRGNKPIPGAIVEWKVAGGSEAAIISAQTPTTATITASADSTKIPPSGIINIIASTTGEGGTPITATLPLKIVNASGFAMVRGSLEMLDFRTAADLYGRQTARDFYVAKITLLNDLKEDLAGASILVFSSSLGIGVNLQKATWAKDRMNGRDVPKAKWEPVTFRDLRLLGLPAHYPLRINELPRSSAPGEPNTDLDYRDIYTCDDIWYAEQQADLTSDEEADPKVRERRLRDRDQRLAAARLRQLRYRPYPYDMVIKSFDPRDNRTARSMMFRTLTFAGSVASFVGGVPNFGASSEFIGVNEKVASMLVPALAVMYPSLKETQRQNLVDDTMHPIEEIPYAASLTKMVFLPKFPFQGFRAGTWFRISEICPFDFQVEVAISHKRQQQTVQTTQPTSQGQTQ